MLNDKRDFKMRNAANNRVPCDRNAEFNIINCCGMPVVLVVTTKPVVKGERLLMNYGWDDTVLSNIHSDARRVVETLRNNLQARADNTKALDSKAAIEQVHAPPPRQFWEAAVKPDAVGPDAVPFW